ncbi:MAG: hypothetical protein EOL90_00415 [Spartobacteria bacterium]|nr:hypothetical protein [Spartobacteria bacterium]
MPFARHGGTLADAFALPLAGASGLARALAFAGAGAGALAGALALAGAGFFFAGAGGAFFFGPAGAGLTGFLVAGFAAVLVVFVFLDISNGGVPQCWCFQRTILQYV